IFDLHAKALGEYRNFVRAYINNIADARLREFVERHALAEHSELWPEPLVQLSPNYRSAHTLDELAREGVIAEQTARLFRTAHGQPLRLYQHQEDAIRKAQARRSFVVTSGTGSGKSLCYFIPIADEVLRQRAERPAHITALVVYPMNALVNSQYQALQTFKERYEQAFGTPFPLTFARYTGEVQGEEREQLRREPPHILLTNYVMLELLMVRPEDRGLLGEGALRFVVFDELHTYRGRQGADVAMLVRRLKARFASPHTIYIGTSATMVAERESTPQQRRAIIADFAQRFFGHRFEPDDVIEETLQPLTSDPPTPDEVRHCFGDAPPQEVEAFRAHPLARWIEYA
ncbi:MAG: DEAD/DEAH box helicase, partial [Bacteroidota bacterium]|nr:DEAD/DEAH box helicase [Bacteroidota bacterium]